MKNRFTEYFRRYCLKSGLPVFMSLALLAGCSLFPGEGGKGRDTSINVETQAVDAQAIEESETESQGTEGQSTEADLGEEETKKEETGQSAPEEESATANAEAAHEAYGSQVLPEGFDPETIPAYSNEAYVEVNGGVPFFTKEELDSGIQEYYGKLDDLGRCTTAYAVVSRERMPAGEREAISDVRPTGFENVRYDGLEGGWLLQRCHLVAFRFTGQNANERNLITGTSYMNLTGMAQIEEKLSSYLYRSDNHVLYRVTPVFEGDNLVATGVLMEAQSIEEPSWRFNYYCYNVQPGVEIDYATGKSSGPVYTGDSGVRSADVGDVSEETTAIDSTGTARSDNTGTGGGVPTEETAAAGAAAEGAAAAGAAAAAAAGQGGTAQQSENSAGAETSPQEQIVTYVGNSNSHKFHLPGCSSVTDMKEHNKVYFYGDRQEVTDAGYAPCKRCNP